MKLRAIIISHWTEIIFDIFTEKSYLTHFRRHSPDVAGKQRNGLPLKIFRGNFFPEKQKKRRKGRISKVGTLKNSRKHLLKVF